MSGVRKYRPENKLAKVLGDLDGIRFDHAVQRAAANVAAARGAYETALQIKLDAMAELTKSAALANDVAQVRTLYRLAQDIHTDAGGLGLSDLTEAARSLCDLMATGRGGAKFWAATAVHIEALDALRRPPKDGSARLPADILKGLAQLSRS